MKNKFEVLIVAILIIVGMWLRLGQTTPQRLHFRGDQASSSLRAKEIWDKKELTLIGIPITSFAYNGHEARVSSTAYYLQLIPLLLGKFDPYAASRVMAILSALMTIPLYFGMKFLTKRRSGAILAATWWALLPNFVAFGAFLWNPNSQLLLLPLAVLFLGLFVKKQQPIFLGLVGTVLGLALTLHFQFAIAVLAVVIVGAIFAWRSERSLAKWWWLIGGVIIGFSPMIAEEFLNDFYNLRLLAVIVPHWSEIKNSTYTSGLPLHYFNSTIFVILAGVTYWLAEKTSLLTCRKLVAAMAFLLVAVVVIFSTNLQKNLVEPPRDNWDFTTEEKVHELIVARAPDNFNIYNVAYTNPFAEIQKYLLALRQPEIYARLSDNYYDNQTLFILARRDEDLSRAINYEIYNFLTTKKEVVPINNDYVLHIWQRANFEASLYPLTIPYLRERDYKSSLGDLEKLRETASYEVFLTHYDSEGFRVNSLLTIPKGERPINGWPAIVFIHGYQNPLTYETDGQAYAPYWSALAAQGFAVLKIDLRGHGDSQGAVSSAYFSSSGVIDALNARSALMNNDWIDSQKIYFWGHSMAGNIILRAVAARPEIPKVAIWGGGVFTYRDWAEYGINDPSFVRAPQERRETTNVSMSQTRRLVSDEISDTDPFWQVMAPANYLSEMKTRIALFHAVNDTVMNVNYSRDLYDLAASSSAQVLLYEYSSGGHDIEGAAFNQAMRDTVDFFKDETIAK